jgi:VanZ family protein
MSVRESSWRRISIGWLPAAAYMALIWTLSSMPIAIPLGAIPFKDKGVHVVEYGTLAALYAYAMRKTWPQQSWLRALALAALLTFAWGYLDELHQAFVPGRNSDAADLLADSIGALLGSAGFIGLTRLRRSLNRSQAGG